MTLYVVTLADRAPLNIGASGPMAAVQTAKRRLGQSDTCRATCRRPAQPVRPADAH